MTASPKVTRMMNGGKFVKPKRGNMMSAQTFLGKIKKVNTKNRKNSPFMRNSFLIIDSNLKIRKC